MNEQQRQTVDDRIKNEKERFLEVLSKNSILSAACKVSGISKATVCRWRNDDPEFGRRYEEARLEGISNVSDMARFSIVSLIQEKNLGAAKFWLTHHDDEYKKGRPEDTKTSDVKGTDLIKKFREVPIAMHRALTPEMRWPKVIMAAYAKIWSGNYSRIIIKAPRGGGKSKLLGTVGFDLWYLKNRSVLNMGGSLAQAEIVYGYFREYCDMDPSVSNSVRSSTNSLTMSTDGQYFSCVAASMKEVRGPHPDVLICDETCESDDRLIHAALPIVDTSDNPLVVMASTFHKIFGIFQETWDNAEERGYLRIQWDIFDVAKQFPADFWQQPEVGAIPGIQKLVAHAKGRTGDPEGWVAVENIVQAWMEKPTEDSFEIEYMGSRPSSAGLVLKPEDIDRAVFDDAVVKNFDYVPGAEVVIGIDWGFSSMTSVVEIMNHRDGVVAMIDNRNYSQTPSEDIIRHVVSEVKAKGVRFIYADSAGKFENDALRNELNRNNLGCTVVEVVFSIEKEGMLGNLRGFFERGHFRMPKRFKEAYWQLKRYRYQEGTDKPVKKDDHIPDSTMCALQHFKPKAVARPFPTGLNGGDRPITGGLLNKKF